MKTIAIVVVMLVALLGCSGGAFTVTQAIEEATDGSGIDGGDDDREVSGGSDTGGEHRDGTPDALGGGDVPDDLEVRDTAPSVPPSDSGAYDSAPDGSAVDAPDVCGPARIAKGYKPIGEACYLSTPEACCSSKCVHTTETIPSMGACAL